MSTSLPEPHLARPPLAPPLGAGGLVKDLFWNERELRAGWRLVIYLFLFAMIAGAGLMLVATLHLPQLTRTNLTVTALLAQEIALLFAALAAAWLMRLLEGRPFGAYGLPGGQMMGERFWRGTLWGIAMIAATTLTIWLFHGFSFGALALQGWRIPGYAILWGVAFLSVGLFEEFLFRGYTLFTLAAGLGFWPAATLLCASFGAVHLRNGGEGPVGALSVFVIAMFFCLTLRRTGSLWFAVGLHAAFDWGETFLFSVPDSGLVAPGHLLSSSFHGARWLTGGTIGPEGSVMVFVVIGLAAVIFSVVYPGQEADQHPR